MQSSKTFLASVHRNLPVLAKLFSIEDVHKLQRINVEFCCKIKQLKMTAWELICSAADHVGADFDDSFAIFENQPPRKHLCVNRLSYV